MIFKTIHEARDWFLQYKPLTEEVISFCYKHDHTDLEFGDWILFQHIRPVEIGVKKYNVYYPDRTLKCQVSSHEEAKVEAKKLNSEDIRVVYEKEISRPILAIFTNFKIWDQALVINYVQPSRAWMRSHQVNNNPDSQYTSDIIELDDEVEAIQFWTDDIKVLAHWKNKPTIAQLKLALKK